MLISITILSTVELLKHTFNMAAKAIGKIAEDTAFDPLFYVLPS